MSQGQEVNRAGEEAIVKSISEETKSKNGKSWLWKQQQLQKTKRILNAASAFH